MAGRSTPRDWVVLLGLLLVGLNLRPAITSVPPLIETIRADIALSYGAVSLLTTIPVFCMGLFALGTPWLIARFGRERSVYWAVALIGVATAARVAGDNWIVLFGSTVLVGIGIAVAQTLLPVIASRYFPDRIAFATGLYSAFFALGAALGSLFTVPVRDLLGSWPLSLAFWAALAVVGVLAWVPILRSPSPGNGSSVRSNDAGLPLGDPLAWLVTLFFAGVTTFFFVAITWLPPRYVALGWSEARAGALVTVFILAGIPGMLVISAFGDRLRDRRPWFVGTVALLVIGAVVVGVAPGWRPWLVATVLGIGSGGTFALGLMLPAIFGAEGSATDRLSSMLFAGGYILAGVGPILFGVLLDVGIGYGVLFLGMAVMVATVGVAALGFRPDRPRVGS